MFEKQVFGKSITSGRRRRLLQEEIELSLFLCLEFKSSDDLELFFTFFRLDYYNLETRPKALKNLEVISGLSRLEVRSNRVISLCFLPSRVCGILWIHPKL
ncbi:unnamed protein product [Citrullus colocynthis]|uniref:Uncharacterized protein n=1 Tax=Citrullus colocynthis TaxID=252529 RepID=A0ABP0XXW6_9ROSI